VLPPLSASCERLDFRANRSKGRDAKLPVYWSFLQR
jgi:hypothetical protein